MRGWAFEYLKLLERKKIRPNFWCSEEYFRKAGFIERRIGGAMNPSVCIFDTDSLMIFPPIDPRNGRRWAETNETIWSDFSLYYPGHEQAEFLDYEYLYEPKNFLNMKGKKWQTFRKNCRKYPRRNEHLELRYVPFDFDKHNLKIFEFYQEWIDKVGWKEFHDYDVMANYMGAGENREILIDNAGDIHGVNIWDENYMFINYRYCFCLNVPFLSEYMRFWFYVRRSKENKIVNDGGVLDSPELKKFKDKMNPVQVNRRYTWNPKPQGE